MNAVPRTTATRRPRAIVAMITVLMFLGVSAVAGSSVLLVPSLAYPDEWLEDIPLVNSWLLPGLVLGVGFGVGSLVVAWGVMKRPRIAVLACIERTTGHHWSWAATLALGLGQVVWISIELIYLPEPAAIQFVYGAVGLALCALPLLTSVRSDLLLDRSPSA